MKIKKAGRDRSFNYKIKPVPLRTIIHTWQDYYEYVRQIGAYIHDAEDVKRHNEEILDNLVGNIERRVYYKRLIRESENTIRSYHKLISKARKYVKRLPYPDLEKKIEQQAKR